MSEKKTILLGQGDLYISTLESPSTATSTELEASLVKIGEISGGATLSLSTEFKDVFGGAKNQLIESFMTSESVSFTTGVCTFDLENISKLIAAYYSEDTVQGVRKLGIGGLKKVPINYLRFVHEKAQDNKEIKINMFRAQNRNGLSLTFSAEDETIIELEFQLLADTTKSNGNLVEIIEEI